MGITPPRVQLPAGLPTFTAGRGRFVWPEEGREPALLLHNDFDLLWVVRGSASLSFRDGTKLTAGRDEFLLLPPFVSGWLDQAAAPLEFCYLHFNFRPSLGTRDVSYRPGTAPPTVPLALSGKRAMPLRRIYADLMELDTRQPGAWWRVESLVLDLVSGLAAFDGGSSDGSKLKQPLFNAAGEHDHRVARLCAQIQREPTRAWVVTELAESIGLSAGRLHTLFKSATGEGIKSYIVAARLRRAMTLLRERRDGELPSIKEVAAACGFSSQHFFSRQFKEHFHVTPVAFRDGTPL